ncbi:Ankyrin-1 [Apis cerana cerana]|uniref:Ankyrin-1 n=1 Tax=Apis cerana cerana TaxID=94128 RepID=A0A2A3EFQ7_APICC|nr:Ankyrin-1 [Apis cerana cerana]
MTPLMYAVKDNRTGLLDRMIELGADDNYNALHVAAMYSREDVVKLLLSKRSVDPYATGGPRQQTAIHLVASRQTGTATSILRALLAAAGRDIRLKVDGKGKIPLLLAVEAGNQSMCRELLAQQAPDQLRATTATGDSALHLAARRRDIDMVRILVDYGGTVDMQNGDGQTALHIASAEGDETLVKYFYGVRASASITDHQDRTPMHLAAENGHASIIELLADKFKASIFERTKDGSTLMHIASLNGHSECATMLFKKGVYLHMPNKRGARSIHTAAKYGHVGIISTLLQRGEKVDATTNDNYTALHIAVESAKPAVVETLLGYGAEVHVRGGKLRETPLHIAARVADGDRCALMLLKSGAGPNLTTDDGQTPVHVAASHGNLATLLLLLEDGGDPMCKSKNGETPLHLACRGCKADVVRHLIRFVKERRGAETATSYVNSLTNEGASGLHYAAQIEPSEVGTAGDDRAVIRALLEGGADVSLQTKQAQESAFHHCALAGNNEILSEMISGMSATEVQKALNRQSAVGWTPLLIAAHRGHMELVTTLLANHARVDVFDLEGRSALHLAAEHGYLQVCDALLANKAFINSKSRVGRTALHLAAMNGYSHLVKFLVQDHGAAIDLGASIDATDDQGQKPIHAAAMNNYAEVAQLFLQRHPSLVMACTKDGNTCAHIAAMQGSVRVIEELMKFDRQGVVRALVRAGASCADENRAGFTAVHLAAQHGHGQVLEVMRSSQSLRISSKKLGVTALHVAAYFGQADTVRELLTHVPGTVKSDPPTGGSLVGELGSESGMTPLHLAAYSGNENVVRLLLNSAGVQVEAATTENGFNPLHLACFGGHITVVGLLLSRSAELLHSSDRYGKTGLHIAATHGHYQMVEVLLGQGAEINATDKNGWTPLHCAARAGYLDVVKLLVESGASPKSETNLGSAPIWFAASEGHNDVLKYLMEKEHDTYALMEDKRVGLVLSLPQILEKSRWIRFAFLPSVRLQHDGVQQEQQQQADRGIRAGVPGAGRHGGQAFQHLRETVREGEGAGQGLDSRRQAVRNDGDGAAGFGGGADSAGRILTSMDRRNVEFLDVLIENEQKEVIAHTVVQRYLQELWQGSLNWNAFRTILLFVAFLVCPPVWVVFALPLGHKYNNVPIIKFMSYLTSHIYLMVFLLLVGIIPIYPVVRASLLPYWYEWCLLVMLSGLLLFELTNPSDKSGLGWIKLAVLLFGICGVAFHLMGFVIVHRPYWPTLLYLRNQLFALSFLLACVQILDFLSFHHLFGPWAIIIGNLMKDLARFLAVLAIFVFGFSMHFVALNQAFETQSDGGRRMDDKKKKGVFNDVKMNPVLAFEYLFFAVFGQTTHGELKVETNQPQWTSVLFKLAFGVYMLVSVVVLINLLIAMMSDTYQRIQAQSDIEWKYGLMHMMGLQRAARLSPRSKMGAKWLAKVKKGQVRPKDSVTLSVVHLSPLGSQLSFNSATRIENVVDWDSIRKKYLALAGNEPEKEADKDGKNEDEENEDENIPMVSNSSTIPTTTTPPIYRVRHDA